MGWCACACVCMAVLGLLQRWIPLSQGSKRSRRSPVCRCSTSWRQRSMPTCGGRTAGLWAQRGWGVAVLSQAKGSARCSHPPLSRATFDQGLGFIPIPPTLIPTLSRSSSRTTSSAKLHIRLATSVCGGVEEGGRGQGRAGQGRAQEMRGGPRTRVRSLGRRHQGRQGRAPPPPRLPQPHTSTTCGHGARAHV